MDTAKRVVQFPESTRFNNYSLGFMDGQRAGESWANQKLFWLGLVAGALLSSGVVMIVLLVAQR